MSETNLEQFREVTPAGRFTLQNSSLLKVRLDNDSIQAKLGSMVAYQGEVRFEHQGGGLGRFFKKALTGEGVKLMSATGTGDLFLAQDARKVMVIDLQNERMTVNGDSILAFDGDVDWDIRRVEGAGRLAGGLFNVVLEGTGKVAVTSHGEPVLLDTSTTTFADPESAIAWSGGVRTSVRSDVSLKTFMGRGVVRRSRSPSKAPAGFLYNPPRDRPSPNILTAARAAVAAWARSSEATSF